MGFNTFASLGSPLVDRLNLVLSSKPEVRKQDYERNAGKDSPSKRQVAFVAGFEQAIEKAENYLASNPCDEPEVFIIGGQKIYEQSMDFVDKLYVTQVHTKLDGDAFYPEIDPKIWRLQDLSPDYFDGGYSFCFRVYGRME